MAVAMADEDMLSLLQFPLDDDDLLELFGCRPHTPENSAWEKQSSAPCAVLDADSVKVHRTIGGVLPQTSVESGLAPPRYSTWNFGHLLGLATRSDEKSSSHNISDAGSSEGYCGRRNSAEGERERERVNSIVELEIADQKGMEGSDSRKANKEEHESLTISTVTCGGAVSTTEAGMEPFDSTYSTEKSGREAGSSVKRKAINRDDFEYQSKDMEDASVQLKKPHSGTSKRRATEIHNQSERRRRDRINEKMRELQALVPNANKTDKASMLDEAIQYLKFLQVQLQIMSIRTGMSIPPMMLPTGMAHLEQTSLFPQTQAGMRMNMVNFGTASTSHLTASLPITSTSFLPGLVCQSNVLQRQSPAPINSLNTNIHMCNVTLQQWQAHQIDPSQLQNNT